MADESGLYAPAERFFENNRSMPVPHSLLYRHRRHPHAYRAEHWVKQGYYARPPNLSGWWIGKKLAECVAGEREQLRV